MSAKIQIDRYTNAAQKEMAEALKRILIQFAGIFSVSVVLVIFFSYQLSNAIVSPIKKLTESVGEIGKGRLDVQAPVDGRDEIAELGATFNKMTADLRQYIKNLREITVEKERINSELSIASAIQNDMLPRIVPPFSGNDNYELFGKMTPAKLVGGDFYDFFYIDEAQTKLGCVIADVSGKGVPAALFMVIAKTVVKQQMLQTGSLGEILKNLNDHLNADNPRSMFVTIFICALDLATGELRYANGGHNPPLLSQGSSPPGGTEGGFQFMKLKKGVPPGMLEDETYVESSIILAPGARLFLYTDGVNEAMNRNEDEFGNDRMLETANSLLELEPRAFDEQMRRTLADFMDGAEQSDDITTLILHFEGCKKAPNSV
jgi:sigma-B regulation protein RsbU (phosphoserine phosphatase)